MTRKDNGSLADASPASSSVCRELAGIMPEIGAVDWMRVGSTVTCDPPPVDTDIDVLVLVKHRVPGKLAVLDFDLDAGGEHYEPSEGQFNSWRRGNLNLIVTDDQAFYNAFWLATKVAKTLNLLEKRDRVTLFQAILYRKHYAPAARTATPEDTQPKTNPNPQSNGETV